jgi:two-component system, NarL family, sensor histidine kinase UhpB
MKRASNIVAIFALLLLPVMVAAQSAGSDSATVFSLINTAESFFNQSNYESAISYCNQAESISKQKKFKKGQAYALIELTDIFIDKNDLSKAQSSADEVNSLGAQMKDSLVTSVSKMQMAQIKMYGDNFDAAIPLFNLSLQYLSRHPSKYTALAYNDLGYTWGRKGEFSKQADNLIKSVSIYEKYFPDKYGEIAITLSNLSSLYYNINQKSRAIEYAKRALVYREKDGDKAKLSLSCCNISQFYIGIDNAESEKYLNLCEKYALQSNQQPRIIHSYVTASYLYGTEKKYADAFDYEKKAIALLEKNNDNTSMLATRYVSAATLSRDLKMDTNITLGYFNKALNLLRLSHDKITLRDCYINLYNYYTANSNYPAALAAYRKYVLYKDSIISENTQSAIAEISTRYETKKKDDEIIRLNIGQKIKQLEIEKQKAIISGNLLEAKQKENEITLLSQQKELQDARLKEQDERLEKQLLVSQNNAQQLKLSRQERQLKENELKGQKQLLNFTIGGVIALILLAGFIFNRYQLKKEIDQHKEMLTVRNNIARDLHDEIGSTLTSIKILSEVSKNNIEKDTKKASFMLSKITEQSTQMQQGMSDIIWAIKPDNDKMENMLVRMREYAAYALESKDIDVSFVIDDDVLEKNLDMQQRRDVFLIFKEAVNNAAKYSGAAAMKIKLQKAFNNIEMEITDNGKGFERAESTLMNGLKNMQARAAAMNAKLEIISGKGKGTSVIVKIPAT